MSSGGLRFLTGTAGCSLLTTWFKSGSYYSRSRAGDGYFGPYMNTGRNLENTPISADGSIGGLKFIVGCPSQPVGPVMRYLTSPYAIGGGRLMPVDRARSYGMNWGDPGHEGGLFEDDITLPPPSGGHPGYRLMDLPARITMLADSSGEEPFLLGPSGYAWEDFTYSSPAPRHVDAYNTLFLDGHAKNGSVDKYWAAEYWYSYWY